MQLIKEASKEKLRGGFYTPEPIASFILKWAFNVNEELDILEPSCGDGVFLEEIQKRNYEYNSVTAIEFDEVEAAKSGKISLGKSKIINSDFHEFCINTKQKFDLIVANLPYLKHEQMEEPSIKKEPRSALLSGKQGLDHYTKLLSNIAEYLNKKFLILLEIDPQQNTAIKNLIKKYLPKANIEIIQDLNKLDRLVKISSK